MWKNLMFQQKNNFMKNTLFLILLFLTSCSGKMSDNEHHSPFDKKILEIAKKAQLGESPGPIYLSYRKLQLEEIAEHLDMDVDTAKLHIKEMNIHGYFSLIPHNLPSKGEFTLYHVNFEGKISPGKTFFINGNGFLVTPLDDTFVDFSNNFLFFANYLAGEPVEFVLASKDGKLLSSTYIVPNPIQYNSNGQKITAEIASADKRVYLIKCCGFKPGSEYTMITRFENEKFVHSLAANNKGEMTLRTGPNSPFITGGDGSIDLKGDDLKTPIQIKFQWGML